MKIFKIVFVIITVLLFTSCSLEKRHYMSGYSVSWNKKYSSEENKKNKEGSETVASNKNDAETNEYPLTASNEKNILLSSKAVNQLNLFTTDSCDVIELKNNTKIQAKVVEINQSSVKYKNCGNPDGPTRVLSKTEIAGITYSNGEKESVENLKYTASKEEKLVDDYSKPKESKKMEPVDYPLATHAIIAGGCSFIPVIGWIFGLLSIVFGLISLNNINKYPEHYKGRKKALIGLWLGVAGLLAGIIIVIVIFTSFGAI